MILRCIGTGTAAPEPDRACSGYLLEAGRLRLLLDCGPGVVHGLARAGADWAGITHLLLTHFHNDHIGDVPALFFAWKHGMRPARSVPLTVVGPDGTAGLLAKMADLFGDHVRDTPFPMVVDEVAAGDERWLADGVRLRAGRTAHTPESLAYRVEAGGRAFCYTGDTGPSDEVGRFAQGADLLLAECSVPDDEAMPTHLTPSQAAGLARAALPGRLLLTHVYPQLERDRVPGLVRAAGWTAAVSVPQDGDVFDV